MSEKSAVRDVFIKIAIVLVFATLYMLGGWGEFLDGAKWLRRFVAPCVLSGGIFYFTRNWKALLIAPIVGLGASLGYGADNLWAKILKRGYCGIVMGIGTVADCIIDKKFVFSVFQTLFITVAMIYLGVANPLSDARAEEFCIGLLIAILPVMAARRK